MNAPAGFRAKASVLRAYLRFAQRERLVDELLARVQPPTAALLRQPPLPSTWLDGSVLIDVQNAIEALRGLDGILQMAELTVRDALPHFTGAVVGLLRMFGASPATLFRHLGQLVRSSVDGVEYEYEAKGERAGVVTARYPAAHELPKNAFYAVVPTLQMVLQLCKAPGEVSLPKQRRGNSAEYSIRW
jgi:hypothetical protein